MNEIACRLTMLEFMLEVMLSNDLARIDELQSAAFRKDLVEKSKRAYGVMAHTPEAIAELQAASARVIELTERFAHKVATREAELRAHRARM
jgi:hypothetical protein